MEGAFVCQGRVVNPSDLEWLRQWITEHFQWSRFRLAQELCRLWSWQTLTGQLKDFAARSFLRKLHARGLVKLPPIRTAFRRNGWGRKWGESQAVPAAAPVESALGELLPLTLEIPARGSEGQRRFGAYLAHYHYLGFERTVGENLQYLVWDAQGREVAALLFGAAAWRVAARDAWIGWTDAQRQKRIQQLTNNTRFLIFPWVRVPHLASHILGCVGRRIGSDWQSKYGHAVHALETFVDRARFKGTCYRAANWLWLGATRGRTRNDRAHRIRVAVKDVYLYPLSPDLRRELCA
jgi:hypothetical protein